MNIETKIFKDFEYTIVNDEICITQYIGDKVDVVIPNEIENKIVTKIGYKAFFECSNIKNISIPNTIMSIGEQAFRRCDSLSHIEIPNSVVSIGKEAFRGCVSLTDIKIPNNVKEIGTGLFIYCLNLKNVFIGNGINIITDFMFSECSSLEIIEIPSSVIEIGKGAFNQCTSLIEVEINNSVERIDDFAFSDNIKLKLVQIPNNVKYIGEYAFRGCTNLEEIDIPDEISVIEQYTFYGCTSLKKVKLPSNIKTIENGAFGTCKNLNKINIPNSAVKIGDFVFNECHSLSEIELGNNVEEIGEYAFCQCDNLGYIKLPEKVKIIEEGTFSECKNLKTIEGFSSIEKIKGRAFSECKNLIEIDLGEDLKYIDDFAFNECTSLIEVKINNGVERIDDFAFSDCKSIEDIVIPNSVVYLGEQSFNDCINLKYLNLGNNIQSIGKHAFANCKNLKKIKIPNNIKKIDIGTFSDCSNLISVESGYGIESIGDFAFDGCHSLEKINMSNNLINIGEGAFNECSSLIEVELGSSIKDIGKFAFANCNNLNKFTINSRDVSICEDIFITNESNLPKKLTIYGYTDSTVYDYVKKTGINFALIGSIEDKSSDISTTEKKLDFLGDQIIIHRDRVLYNNIRLEYESLAKKAKDEFINIYNKNNYNLDSVINNAYDQGISVINPIINETVKKLVGMKFYNINSDLFTKKYCEKSVRIWNNAYDEINDKYIEITLSQEEKKEYRRLRKDSRSRWQGGGFGFEGAIKGATSAGAMNLASGIAHSTFNAIGNIGSSISANREKSKIFNDEQTIKKLSLAIYASVWNIHIGYIKFLKENGGMKFNQPYGKDIDEANIILENIKEINIDKQERIELYKRIIELNPYQHNIYNDIIEHFGDSNNEISNIANYFGIDIYSYKKLKVLKMAENLDTSNEDKTLESKLTIMREIERLGIKENLEVIKILDNKLKKFDLEARTVNDIVFETRDEAIIAKTEKNMIEEIIQNTDLTNEQSIYDAKDKIIELQMSTKIKDLYLESLERELERLDRQSRTVNNILYNTKEEADIARNRINEDVIENTESIENSSNKTIINLDEEIFNKVKNLVISISQLNMKSYIYYYGECNIASKKFENAIKSYADISKDEKLLLCYDNTVFGSAKDGILITNKKVYIHNMLSKAESIDVLEIDDI